MLRDVSEAQAKRVAVCFFGIPRSLVFTHRSIMANVVEPFRARAETRLHAHFFDQDEIDNPRSGEFGALDPEQHRLLPLDTLMTEPADGPEVTDFFQNVRPFGIGWKNDERTLRNLCHQLHSLSLVTKHALDDGADVIVFARPDLYYHDSFEPIVDEVLSAPDGTFFSPFWQRHGGFNDRFGITVGRAASLSYGTRGDRAVQHCTDCNERLGAESFLGTVMAGFHLRHIPHRATRVRFDGATRDESFDTPEVTACVRGVKNRIRQPGMRDAAIAMLRAWQAVRYGPRYRGIKINEIETMKPPFADNLGSRKLVPSEAKSRG